LAAFGTVVWSHKRVSKSWNKLSEGSFSKDIQKKLAKTLKLSFFTTRHQKILRTIGAHSESTDLILVLQKNIHLVTQSL
jgi:hypothetical protein